MMGFRALLLVVVLAGATQAFAQDSTLVHRRGAQHVGLCGGLNWSNIRMQSSPFLLEGGGTGDVTVRNVAGVSGGIFVAFPKAGLRTGVELTLMPSELVYRRGTPNDTESEIHPLTAEIPLSWLTPVLLNSSRLKPKLMAGTRLVIPITPFSSESPELLPVYVNVEGGIHLKVGTKSTTGGVEFFYSLGVINLIREGSEDYRTHAVQSLYRDFAGLRFYFN
ncbi:MAG: hypothetical protein ACK500_01975 [Flavobacteriales bacterium]|jgi:hypothetical protein